MCGGFLERSEGRAGWPPPRPGLHGAGRGQRLPAGSRAAPAAARHFGLSGCSRISGPGNSPCARFGEGGRTLQFYSQRSVINAGSPAWNVLCSCNILPTSCISGSKLQLCRAAIRTVVTRTSPGAAGSLSTLSSSCAYLKRPSLQQKEQRQKIPGRPRVSQS